MSKTTNSTAQASSLGLDLNGNPYLARGSYRTADGKAQIDWTLASRKTDGAALFSASGTYKGGSGQCIEEIGRAYPKDERVQEMLWVWRRYHLNDMHPEDEHQRSLGWPKLAAKPLTLVSYGPPVLEARKAYPSQAQLDRELKGWVSSRSLVPSGNVGPGGLVSIGGSNGVGDWRTYERTIRAIYDKRVAKIANPNDPRALWFAETFGCQRKEETKTVGWVTPEEHPEGLMGKPCPVCGYRYGTEWKTLPIPADVVAQITSWTAKDNTGGVSGYEATAQAFLERNGLALRITKADSKPAPWDGPSGHHYRVTLSRKGKPGRLVFDWWGSQAMAEKGEEPRAYDVLSSVSSEINTPETFADFCAEFGENSDSIKARQTWKRADSFARRLRAFFTDAEREELAEIN